MYRLVIADDEEAVRTYLANEIPWNDYGFRLCGTASGGKEALDLVERMRPHLLITDIRMDDMSGLTVLEQVRSLYPNTQVVILSAYGLFEYAQQAIIHSAAGYLIKPVEKEELEKTLRKVVSLLQHGHMDGTGNPIELAREYMRAHYEEKLTLEQVSTVCFVHPTHLSRLFRTHYNMTFSDYLTEVRIEKAAQLLLESEYRVRDISQRVGYEDYSYFCRVFRKIMGSTPLEYRCNLIEENE